MRNDIETPVFVSESESSNTSEKWYAIKEPHNPAYFYFTLATPAQIERYIELYNANKERLGRPREAWYREATPEAIALMTSNNGLMDESMLDVVFDVEQAIWGLEDRLECQARYEY